MMLAKFWVLTILVCSPLTFFAQNTLNVPAVYPTIQAALTASNNGDTIIVAPGNYFENLNFSGKAVTLTSSGGASVTVIDGGGGSTVVNFTSGETLKSVLNGFTIRNGNSTYYAGGIQITNSSPTITNNVITQNHGISGVGITVYGGSPLIQNNTITGNTQSDGSGGGGGGISTGGTSTNPSSPSIIGNTITNNSVSAGGNGGGIYASYFGHPLIQNNLIQGNIAYNDGGGISIWSYDGATVQQNLIINNKSLGGGSGAGIDLENGGNVAVENNVLVGNSAFDGSSGIYWSYPLSATISNNIIVAAAGQTAIVCKNFNNVGSPIISHNDLYSASGLASSGVCDISRKHLGGSSVRQLYRFPFASFVSRDRRRR